MSSDYVVRWQEWESPPPGVSKGYWRDHSETFDTVDEALDHYNELLLAGEGVRRARVQPLIEAGL